MAEAGRINPAFTHIEVDEQGRIWCIQNHFESDTVITEMEESAHGRVIIDDLWSYYSDEEYDDDLI